MFFVLDALPINCLYLISTPSGPDAFNLASAKVFLASKNPKACFLNTLIIVAYFFAVINLSSSL